MKKKQSSNLKKVLVIIMIMFIFMPSVAQATSNYSGMDVNSSSTSSLSSNNIFSFIMNMYSNVNKYKSPLNNIDSSLNNVNTNMNLDDAKTQILEILQNAMNTTDSGMAQNAIAQLMNQTITLDASNTSGLLSSLKSVLSGLLGKASSSMSALEPDIDNDTLSIKAETAGDNIKLTGNIYFAEQDQGKWAVLVHGFNMTGKAMGEAIAKMYLDNGYNVLAPDSRGFGNSEGENNMGYTESLDVWDWLTYINSNYNVNKVIVHGVSLGGATTLFLSGLEVNGKNINDQNVIGLVDDCGFTSMTGIVKDLLGADSEDEEETTISESKSSLVSTILGLVNKDALNTSGASLTDALVRKLLISMVNTGLTEENFDENQSGLNKLANTKANLSLLVIHGQSDSIVKPHNGDDIYAKALENENIKYVQKFMPEGEQHAFIVIGKQANNYENHVTEFIKNAEKIADSNFQTQKVISSYTSNEAESGTSIITQLIKTFRLIKSMFNK